MHRLLLRQRPRGEDLPQYDLRFAPIQIWEKSEHEKP